MERDEMLKDLRAGACEVVFTKVDGTERTMVCSLSNQLLPEVSDKESKAKVVENPDVIQVYDLEVEGWRSFRVDSVISFYRVEWNGCDRQPVTGDRA